MPVETDEVGHVLVVDDDAMVRRTIINYSEQQNVPAASVSSRQDLSRHLEKAHPSLILLDLRLGSEDRLDVLKEIRSRIKLHLQQWNRLNRATRFLTLNLIRRLSRGVEQR
jgi:CheY-like chemotaxis protein